MKKKLQYILSEVALSVIAIGITSMSIYIFYSFTTNNVNKKMGRATQNTVASYRNQYEGARAAGKKTEAISALNALSEIYKNESDQYAKSSKEANEVSQDFTNQVKDIQKSGVITDLRKPIVNIK